MKESANQAGIDNCRLRLVLEPEAASVYCQAHCTLRTIRTGGKVKLEPFPVNHTYIVADLGGGTADIATHLVLTGGNLRELFRATGGALGGTEVNKKFILFLEEVFGSDIIKLFRTTYRSQYMDLLRDFESKKKRVTVNTDKPMRLKWPTGLTDIIKQEHRKTPAEYVKERNHEKLIIFKRDKFQIISGVADYFFKQISDDIVAKIVEILQTQSYAIDSLLVVGGFADSLYLREKIKQAIFKQSPGIDIVKPEEADLHVLKGAVLTTIRRMAISERISPFVYGLRSSEPFDEKAPSQMKRNPCIRLILFRYFQEMH
ncbi:heat shock 70 kDa protein 12A-like [Mercenaria mercenaria]|uniref:heat shock 70 kDa protein 12A-like n=1 Tax=Mercenaria mercenaria TaxID=6596 RepID=UPI00234EC175|nr:heat shock 70 kDa protein 12A-like [Mercenaria mercenaria]